MIRKRVVVGEVAVPHQLLAPVLHRGPYKKKQNIT